MEKQSNTNTIEAGSIVKFIYGAGCGEEFGVLVEMKITEWGTQYKVITEEGKEQWTSEIRNEGERSANGSGIGCYLVK